MATRIVRHASMGLIALVAIICGGADKPAQTRPSIFDRDNLVAWCIVPYDAKHSTPAERAAMLERLGIRHFAYDWRNQHLASFDAELDELAKHHIELTAVWFPAPLNDQTRVLLDTLAKHKLEPQLWVMADVNSVQVGVDTLTPIAHEAAKVGCTVGLYNHGGWFGEPENQLAILERLKQSGVTNVGLVYNLHHGHAHLDRFPQLLAKMKPHLLALNLNGMVRGGETTGRQILPIGQGDLDLSLLKTIRDSGYAGPIGILNHTDEDAEGRLLDNVEGLEWLVPQLGGMPPVTPKPTPRTWKPSN
jgi:sugar phosphate isomerase/epimerase